MYFYRLNLAVVRDADVARLAERRAQVVVRALESAELELGRRPDCVVADGTMKLNLDVLEEAGLALRRVARGRADVLTVDLLAKCNGRNGTLPRQAKLL
jgi:hypothetical protein